jgi:transcriptional regulator of acetoin/glycerol metabolism
MEQTLTMTEEIVHLVNQLARGQVQPLKVARRAVVKWALAKADGNVSQAAQMLKISRGTIYRYARS